MANRFNLVLPSLVVEKSHKDKYQIRVPLEGNRKPTEEQVLHQIGCYLRSRASRKGNKVHSIAVVRINKASVVVNFKVSA